MRYQATIIFLFSLFLSACDAPIYHRSESISKPKPSAKATASTQANQSSSLACPYTLPNTSICFSLEWFDRENKKVSGPLYYKDMWTHAMSVQLSFWSEKDGKALDPLESVEGAKYLAIKMWMPTHGHGSMVPQCRPLEKLGSYLCEKIHFIMHADKENPWSFKVQVKSGNDEIDYNEVEDRQVIVQREIKIDAVPDAD